MYFWMGCYAMSGSALDSDTEDWKWVGRSVGIVGWTIAFANVLVSCLHDKNAEAEATNDMTTHIPAAPNGSHDFQTSSTKFGNTTWTGSANGNPYIMENGHGD